MQHLQQKYLLYLTEVATEKLKKKLKNPSDEEVQKLVRVDSCWDKLICRSNIEDYSYNAENEENYVKIKLLLEDMNHHSIVKHIANYFTKSMDKIESLGVYHASLMIGPYKTEWMGNGIADIKFNAGSETTLLSIDIGKVNGVDFVKKTLEHMTSHACFYNGFIDYNVKSRNCQHYVEGLLKKLADDNLITFKSVEIESFVRNGFTIPSRTSSQTMQYLSQMKSKFSSTLNLELTREEWEKFKKDDLFEDGILEYFSEQKDNFLKEIKNYQLQSKSNILTITSRNQAMWLAKKYPDSSELLKAFDRAFAFRLLACENNCSTENKQNWSCDQIINERIFGASGTDKLPDYQISGVFLEGDGNETE